MGCNTTVPSNRDHKAYKCFPFITVYDTQLLTALGNVKILCEELDRCIRDTLRIYLWPICGQNSQHTTDNEW